MNYIKILIINIMESYEQLGGKPFSFFLRKRKKQNTKKLSKKIKQKTKKLSKKSKIIKCKCNHNKQIKSKDDLSPESLGYCSYCVPTNVIMKGNDGDLWENKKIKTKKKWIKLKI